MAKLAALFCITLLLCYTFAYGARPAPAVHLDHHQTEEGEAAATESCDGAATEEDCLMRRTLAAHIDYIYTQKHHP